MNAGEFFISIGLKGSDKTVGQLNNVGKGLDEVKSTSLAMKAAIVGSLYELGQMANSSMKTGVSLTNFNTLLGISTDTLQRWQYAGRQAGASADEIKSSFENTYNAMKATKFNNTDNPAIKFINQLLGPSGKSFDRTKIMDIEYVYKTAQEAMKKGNHEVNLEIGQALGMSQNMIAAMEKGLFNKKMLDQAPILGKGQVSNLNKFGVDYENVVAKLTMAKDKFFSSHGSELVQDFDKMIPALIKLAEVFEKLLTKGHGFEILQKTFEGLALIIEQITNALDGLAKDFQGGFFKGLINLGSDTANAVHDPNSAANMTLEGVKLSIKDMLFGAPGAPAGNTQVNIHQENHFSGTAVDHDDHAKKIKKATHDAIKKPIKNYVGQSAGKNGTSQ